MKNLYTRNHDALGCTFGFPHLLQLPVINIHMNMYVHICDMYMMGFRAESFLGALWGYRDI